MNAAGSEELRAILALVPSDFADPGADYLAVRQMLGPFHGHPVPGHISVEETELGGVRAAWYDDRRTARRDRVAFHCHGGGLVACPLEAYHFYGAMLVEQLGVRVVLPDYRLAPEHVFPAAHDDCLNAYRGLLESGVDPGRVVVMGDSCGGGLALSTLIAARDAGLPMPACFVSVSGWFDLSVARPAETGVADPFLSAEWVRNRGRDYTANRVALEDPRVSPAFADLSGLPPLYLPVGQHDTVREGVLDLAASALRSGVAVTLESWPGVGHGWQGLVGAGVPEATAAWRRTAQFIDALTQAV
ncbi:MAG TPA: alpha/beta hydrolase [Acidimicrobiales bacterium]|nr:alpha/beta hydrolase [Acidimicrobiales bacterium]